MFIISELLIADGSQIWPINNQEYNYASVQGGS